MNEMHKYPRTQHIEGSGIQKGDEDLDTVPLREFAGRHLVVEEKMDGANSAISFSTGGRLQLQSRGHYLGGGEREKQFHLLKTWAHRYALELWEALADRYIMYGEWLYAKHTVFYTDLPHYFMEFDILDKSSGAFLSTERRQDFLCSLPFVVSVKVLSQGPVSSMQALKNLVGPSHFIPRSRKMAESKSATNTCVAASCRRFSILRAIGWIARSCPIAWLRKKCCSSAAWVLKQVSNYSYRGVSET